MAPQCPRHLWHRWPWRYPQFGDTYDNADHVANNDAGLNDTTYDAANYEIASSMTPVTIPLNEN
jgi:hypothetical protein